MMSALRALSSAASEPSPGRQASSHRLRESFWPLGLYALLSLLLFGLPVLGHLGSRIVASDDIDSSQFMWFFAWWPHALLHGLNPFVTHLVFAPEGYNLSWATAMPGPSIALSPVTLAFGPAVTWNVIQLATPALDAWTAFLLCRHVTGRVLPSLVGGYVYGFSPYVLAHLTGGPFLALVPLLPVIVLLVVRRVDGSMSTRRFFVAMTAALTGQYLISTEVLATATMFGGAALLLAFVLLAEHRAALIKVAMLLVVAYAATAVLVSPFLYYFILGRHYPPSATYFTAPAAGYVIPPPNTVALTRHFPPFGGSDDETYVGLPLVMLMVLFLWQQRRDRGSWLIVLSLLVPAVCALGGFLRVRNQFTTIRLPWYWIGNLSVLRYATTVRFGVYVVLGAAVIVAIWLSRTPQRGRSARLRWGLVLAVIAFIVPDVGSSAWDTHIKDPPFFSSGAYRAYLKPSDRLLTIPAYGPNDRWQADTGFRFALATRPVGQGLPVSYTGFPTYQTMLTGKLTPDYAAQLRRLVDAKGVTAIVVDESIPGPWRTLFGTLGVRPVSTDGVLFYRLRGSD